VRAILLHIESPGGTVGGTAEAYDAIVNSRKPVHSHIEDLGASAALWIASASKSISANKSAAVGSIGTYTAIQDTSGAYAKDGVKVHVISSGGVKGGGVDGAPISDAYLAETQKRIDSITDLFVEAVAKGRGMSSARVKELADGRIHLATAAKGLGLIDKVASLDEAHFSIARSAMNEDQIKAAEALAAEKSAENEQLKAKLAEATKALGVIAAERELAGMAALVAGLKNLPAQEGLAAALVTVKAAAPEAFAVIETQLRAWDGQVKVSALFEENGSTRPAAEAVDINDAEKFRAAGDALVKDGKFPNRYEAMKHLRAAQGGN
jgi:signal peptide peptidase SppA